MKIVSLFSGAGGLDLGFKKAGFDIIFANEFDKKIWETYRKNHKNTILNTQSIVNLKSEDIPDCDGIIGGPPCQSWSEAGKKRGLNDAKGKLFFEFTRVLKDKRPKFFMAENVSGMLSKRHEVALKNIKKSFSDAGYNIYTALLNAHNYGSAQDRSRLIFIGFRKDLKLKNKYEFPQALNDKFFLKDIIYDLKDNVVPALNKSKPNPAIQFPNHEYLESSFSSMFMSRNRVRLWEEPSFTIQAGGRHAPLHPDTGKMKNIGVDRFEFVNPEKVRRLSVRECARVQGFPDDFIFHYNDLTDGYKMVGNAVSVDFAYQMALSIMNFINKNGIGNVK